ncbi:mannose-ethanolamine phosphotransferase gpi13 [Gurleya vavrai]
MNLQLMSSILSLTSVYFYFTGLFKLKKPKNDRSTYKTDPQYKNLVFILLDGLRIDAACSTYHKTLYHNNMKFINSLTEKNKKIYLSVSGVPTATSIRVRSILTGVSSNFLNGTDTFTHKKIEEDSLIDKIKNESFFFYGDDTWIDLFPVLKDKSVTIPAYGKDRTFEAENKVMRLLINDVNKIKYLFGHFSLLDCYGHDYTVFSKPVKMILEEYDKMIEEIYNKMNDDTLMVILSDHGVNDDGSHGGGNIKEISSTGIFISKKDFKNYQNIHCKKIRDDYIKKIYDSDTKWVKPKEKIEIIHQNDIVPTTCALIGLSIPFNCIGNLIPELTGEDRNLYENLIIQKLQSLDLKNNSDLNELNFQELQKISYDLSEKIFASFSGVCGYKLCISFVLLFMSIYVIVKLLNKRNLIKLNYVVSYFVLIMVSHSVYSFIHEDLIWGIVFLINNLTMMNLYNLIFFLMIGKYPQHEEDRFFALNKIGNYYNGNLIFFKIIISYFFLLYALKIKKLKGNQNLFSFFINECFDKKLFLILLKYCNIDYFDIHKIDFLCNDLSFENLSMFLYDPPTLFFIHFILKDLQIKNSVMGFALTNMSIFYAGMNYSLSSIKYDVIFTFDKKADVFTGYLLMLFYFLYPRFKLLNRIKSKEYLLLSSLNAIGSMIVGLWFINDFLFYFFFGGRCFFICFYYVVECTLSAFFSCNIKR